MGSKSEKKHDKSTKNRNSKETKKNKKDIKNAMKILQKSSLALAVSSRKWRQRRISSVSAWKTAQLIGNHWFIKNKEK